MAHDSLTIRRLTPELKEDFLQYFEGAAFADNPKWKSCYCQFRVRRPLQRELEHAHRR